MLEERQFPLSALRLKTDILWAIAILVSLIALSFTAILIKLSEAEIGSNATVLHRLWMATIVFWVWEGFNSLKQPENSTQAVSQSPNSYQEKGLLILVAAVSTASIVCWAWSLNQTSVSNSTVLRNLTTLFTSICGWFLLNHRFDRKFILGMGLAIAGALVIGWGDFNLDHNHFMGDAIALFSAFLYAIYLLVLENLRNRINTSKILLWRCAFGALLLFPFVLSTKESLFPTSYEGWLILIALAIVCQVVGQGLLVYSMKRFSSSFLAVFLLLEPILTALLAWMIFAENLNLFNGIAFVLIIAGIYLAKSSNSAIKAALDN
ncbi:MAG: DMT family transporter [Xenococcus sp. (in: cyanobacteria)]